MNTPIRGLAAFAFAILLETLAMPAAFGQTTFSGAPPAAPAATPMSGTGSANATTFGGPAPTGYGPQVGNDYKIRPGDELTMTVYGEPTLSPQQPLRVLPGGAVEIPLLGEVIVGGKTPADASDIVAQKLKRYLRQPRVTMSIFSVAPVEALVLGNVKTPGKYVLNPPVRLTDVLAAAGGLGPTDGDLPDARIETASGSVRSISLQKLLHDGDVSLNMPIVPGDEVYVPAPATFDIQVIGAVQKPGDVVLHDGDNLAMAVARAGTSADQNPDLNRVAVSRTKDGKTTTRTINLYDVLKNGDVAQNLPMQKGDIVYVPQAPKHQGGSPFGDALILLRQLIFI